MLVQNARSKEFFASAKFRSSMLVLEIRTQTGSFGKNQDFLLVLIENGIDWFILTLSI